MSTDTKKILTLDLETVKSYTTNCFSKNNNDEVTIQNCDYLNRLVNGLKYYTLITKSKNGSSNDIFMDFINVYPKLIDDYTHFIDTHGIDLERIHNQLINHK